MHTEIHSACDAVKQSKHLMYNHSRVFAMNKLQLKGSTFGVKQLVEWRGAT